MGGVNKPRLGKCTGHRLEMDRSRLVLQQRVLPIVPDSFLVAWDARVGGILGSHICYMASYRTTSLMGELLGPLYCNIDRDANDLCLGKKI
jgi:hypothetical protein